SSINIIPINFPSPPSIVVSEVDVNNRFINRSTIATHIQIVPLQFPVTPLVETTSVDEEVYLGVKREEPPRLTPQTAPAASSGYEEQEEKSEKTQITNELYDFIERGVGTFTYIKATGSTVIVYDEKKIGIQNSLARLAAEIAKIKSASERDYDPILISNRNSLNLIKTDEPELGRAFTFSTLNYLTIRKATTKLKKLSRRLSSALWVTGLRYLLCLSALTESTCFTLLPTFCLLTKNSQGKTRKQFNIV
ncbi:MAG: hypothetical protein K1T65_10155, partial [Candidatus Aramenus sp.]|nr:hypothetical protein [Candidatus Aramenus sp.]